jgi:hypothetical protein
VHFRAIKVGLRWSALNTAITADRRYCLVALTQAKLEVPRSKVGGQLRWTPGGKNPVRNGGIVSMFNCGCLIHGSGGCGCSRSAPPRKARFSQEFKVHGWEMGRWGPRWPYLICNLFRISGNASFAKGGRRNLSRVRGGKSGGFFPVINHLQEQTQNETGTINNDEWACGRWGWVLALDSKRTRITYCKSYLLCQDYPSGGSYFKQNWSD